MYQQNLCRLMELVLAPMQRSMQTCISQQQLQKQFGTTDSSMYNLQLPAQTSQAAAQSVAQLSTSMAELLDVGGLTPQVSGVSSMGSQSWDPSASLHLHQSLLQQQLQQQVPVHPQSQHSQSQAQLQPQTHPDQRLQHPPVQTEAQQNASQSLFRPSPQSQDQSHLGHHNPPSHLASTHGDQTQASSGYQSEHLQGSGSQSVSVSIIAPAVWTAADRQSPQPAPSMPFNESTHSAQVASASAPAASQHDLAAAYGSSTFDPSTYSSAQHQQQLQHPFPQQQPQQQLPPQQMQQHLPQQHSQQLSPRPPLGTSDSKRSIATNTQLTMHRGVSDAHTSGAAQASMSNAPAAASPAASDGWVQTRPQDPSSYLPTLGDAAAASGASSRQTNSQPVLRTSDSTGSLTAPVEGLEGRSSGQMPMRAGSPALGGRAFPKPPSWSSHMHDPFGDLVTKDLKSVGSGSSSIN